MGRVMDEKLATDVKALPLHGLTADLTFLGLSGRLIHEGEGNAVVCGLTVRD